jgi:hypothetical protein
MGLESASFLDELIITNPIGAVDKRKEGDDHFRLVKSVLKSTFPGLAGRVWRFQQKATNYTVLATDNMSIIEGTDAITLALTAAVSLGNGFMFVVLADGGDVTIDPNSSETINGETTLTVPDGSAVMVFCDGTLFWAFALLLPSSVLTIEDINNAVASGLKRDWIAMVPDTDGVLVAGTNVAQFRAPHSATILAVRAGLKTGATTGTVTVDINVAGSTILSTKLTIDATEKTSTTAAVPAVVSDDSIDDDAEITIDVDDDGAGDAAGLKVTLLTKRTS